MHISMLANGSRIAGVHLPLENIPKLKGPHGSVVLGISVYVRFHDL